MSCSLGCLLGGGFDIGGASSLLQLVCDCGKYSSAHGCMYVALCVQGLKGGRELSLLLVCGQGECPPA